jgi:hypothetical protein
LYRRRGRWAHRFSSTVGTRQNATRELEELRELEAPIRNGATGEDIENLLMALAEHLRGKPERLFARYFFNDCMNREQRTRTYEFIVRLVEDLPGRRTVQYNFVLKQKRDRENAEFEAKLRAAEADLS